MLCWTVAEENADYRSHFPATRMKSVLCELLLSMSLSCDAVCCFFCRLPFIIVHVFLWDCGVLVSMGFCYAALVLEQGAYGTKAAEAKINSVASNNVLPATSAFIK